jgi:MoxR-like ATPase
VAQFAQHYDALADNVETFIRGKTNAVHLALICMLAEGHLLIDDVPGVGKTSLAKAIASSIDGSMRRIQFTPDLLPSDVTGVQIYNAATRQFEFREGGVFANVVLGDEINRASPKTQSALLEVMEEQQVTIDSYPHAVPRPFIVIATQNPIEHGGTYELPEAQLDRFMMRIALGYPPHDAEVEILHNRTHGQTTEQLRPVMTASDLMRMVEIAHSIHLAPAIHDYIVTISAATRKMRELRLGVSPRGSLSLAVAAQAHAASQGRTFVVADDVKGLAPYVLAHRVMVRPETDLRGQSADDIIRSVVASVPVPQERSRV